MKKVISLLLIIITIFTVDVEALTKADLTILYLDSIKTLKKPKNYTSVQGGTTTDKYVITLFINENVDTDGITAIEVLDKDTLEPIKLFNNPIKEYGFKHSNDATYNSKTNELLILSGRAIHFLDLNEDRFTQTRTVELSKYYHGLGYDELNDMYVLARTIEDGTLFEIRDTEFNIVKKFKLETNLTKQSLTVYDGNIYYVCYESGKINKYEKVYDGLLKRKENLIYIYNLEGEKQNIFYIPYDYKDIIFGEIENISFNNGKMLIQFNHANKAGYFKAEYKTDINAIITVRVDKDKEKEDNYEYILMNGDKELSKTKSIDGLITYYLKYDKEATYKYSIKKVPVKDKKNNDNELETTKEEYQNIERDLIVDVYYDPVVNRLKAITNSNELLFANNKLYQETEFRLLEEQQKQETLTTTET